MQIHRAVRPRLRRSLSAAFAASIRAGGTLLAFGLAAAATPASAETVYLLADAHTDSAAATTPAGSAISLRVSPAGAAFLRFDLSAVPAGMTVEQATLTVRPLRVLASGVLGAHGVTAEWNEDTLTHERRPAWNEAPVALQNVTEDSAGGGDLTFGVTATVASWLSGTPNNGMALVGDGVVDVDVASKENQAYAHPPRLDILLVPAVPTNP